VLRSNTVRTSFRDAYEHRQPVPVVSTLSAEAMRTSQVGGLATLRRFAAPASQELHDERPDYVPRAGGLYAISGLGIMTGDARVRVLICVISMGLQNPGALPAAAEQNRIDAVPTLSPTP
jgi:hypothetical protein